MSISASFSLGISSQGFAINSAITSTADMGIEPVDTTLPAGNTSTGFVKTDANTAVATLDAAHTIISTDVVDVYWEGGARYGAVATVSGASVALEGGAGTDFPASATVVVVSKTVSIPSEFLGDDLAMIVINTSQNAHVQFLDSGSAELLAEDLVAYSAWFWLDGRGVNPLAGDSIAEVRASSAVAVESTFQMFGLQNATS